MSKDNLTLGDLQEYIDKKSKKESLDTALLFFSSSLGLCFTLIHIFLGELALLYFLPTLFLGWFMPIYIGFIRGSLTLDLVEERVRGWIYLTTGVGLYVIFILIHIFELQTWVRILLFAVFGYIIGRKPNIITFRILEIFGQKPKPTDQIYKSYSSTTTSTLFLTFFLAMLNILKVEIEIVSISISIVLFFGLGAGAIYYEIKARREIERKRDGDESLQR